MECTKLFIVFLCSSGDDSRGLLSDTSHIIAGIYIYLDVLIGLYFGILTIAASETIPI